jgi:hypothetical protein
MIDNNIEGNEMENEFTTDAVLGIMPRNYQDTFVPRDFGFNNRTFTMNVYQYAHNPMELYRANENQPRLNLENYDNTTPGEVALYKGIPMEFRWNPVIREMMMTGNYRIRYRGGSKPQYGYVRSQYNTIAEYADTFAIYPK